MTKSWKIFTVITFVISVVAILIALFEIKSISVEGADMIGWITGILEIFFGGVITILLGWNIYSVISFEKKVNEIDNKIAKEMKNAETKLKGYVDDKIKTTKNEMLFRNYSTIALTYAQDGKYKAAANYYISALNVLIRVGNNEKQISVTINKMLDVIKKRNVKHNDIDTETQDKWLTTLYKVNNREENTKELIKLISELRTKEQKNV